MDRINSDVYLTRTKKIIRQIVPVRVSYNLSGDLRPQFFVIASCAAGSLFPFIDLFYLKYAHNLHFLYI